MNHHKRKFVWGIVLVGMAANGCSKTPDPATQSVAPNPEITNSRIEQIQKEPNLSPEEKQKAIAILKAREVKSPPAAN